MSPLEKGATKNSPIAAATNFLELELGTIFANRPHIPDRKQHDNMAFFISDMGSLVETGRLSSDMSTSNAVTKTTKYVGHYIDREKKKKKKFPYAMNQALGALIFRLPIER